jgi:hypothetical protein
VGDSIATIILISLMKVLVAIKRVIDYSSQKVRKDIIRSKSKIMLLILLIPECISILSAKLLCKRLPISSKKK